MKNSQLKFIIEAALLGAGRPMSLDELRALFGDENEAPAKPEIREALASLEQDYDERGISLKEVASGFRIQVKPSMSPWLAKLSEERAPRYSRALMETLSIIAYRQPVTRGDIEDIRGVAVTTNIFRTLLERNWIRAVGHRDVPGKPELFGTTREFLDYFGLKALDDLPTLADLKDLDALNVQLELPGEAQVPPALQLDVDEPVADESMPSNVSSIDAARAESVPASAAVDSDDDLADAEQADTQQAANVVPLKSH